jgi:hypothetical protein
MEKKILQIWIPRELHKEFHAACILNGESMNSAVVRWVRGYIEKRNGNSKKSA